MFVKRMFDAIEKFPALDQKRWHPGRVVRVNAPGKFDEGVQVPARSDPRDFNLPHGAILSGGAQAASLQLPAACRQHLENAPRISQPRKLE
jgi:hypothetical protein